MRVDDVVLFVAVGLTTEQREVSRILHLLAAFIEEAMHQFSTPYLDEGELDDASGLEDGV